MNYSNYNQTHIYQTGDDTFEMMTESAYDIFTEDTIGSTSFLYDRIGPRVDAVLSDPKNVRKFNQLVNNFISKNLDKLTKSGPCDMIPFTYTDHKDFHELFGFWYEINTKPKTTSENEIRNIVIEFCDFTKSKQTFIQTNSSQMLFYFVIRYFTMHNDAKSLNAALSIYALCVYPLMFSKYFIHGVIESVMKYTIDNLTDKFIFKKSKNLFGALMTSIQNSYSFHKANFKTAKDNKVIAFIQRIRNDQNSLFKKIANEYKKNYDLGNYARETNEDYDPDSPIVDEVSNASTEVQNIVQKVTYPIIEDGVDLVRAEAAAKMSNVSVSDCRHFLTLIFDDKDVDKIQKFIESILFLFIYEDHRTARDIRSQYFLAWAQSLFKKTNSKNKNIGIINDILNFWATNTGIYKKFANEGTRINYKKAIFYYIILSIQKNC